MSLRMAIRPAHGMWQGATFEFTVKIPDLYPHEPPKVRAVTRIYHPNIDTEGAVCLNILREDWKPILSFNSVLHGMIFLFYDPNPDDPLNKDAAALFRQDRRAFERNVQRSLKGYEVDGIRCAYLCPRHTIGEHRAHDAH